MAIIFLNDEMNYWSVTSSSELVFSSPLSILMKVLTVLNGEKTALSSQGGFSSVLASAMQIYFHSVLLKTESSQASIF